MLADVSVHIPQYAATYEGALDNCQVLRWYQGDQTNQKTQHWPYLVEGDTAVVFVQLLAGKTDQYLNQ